MFIFGFVVGMIVLSLLKASNKEKEKQDAIYMAYQKIALEAGKIKTDAEDEAQLILKKANKTSESLIIDAEKIHEKSIKETEKYKEKENSKILKDRAQLESDIEKHKKVVAEMQEIYFEKISYHIALEEITNFWVNDEFQNVLDGLNSTNYATQQVKLNKIFEKCDKLGLDINNKDISRFEKALKEQHLIEIENQKAKEEQNRIREIMREEQRAEKFRAEELKRIEKEEIEIAKRKVENEAKINHLQELELLKNITLEQQAELDSLKTEHVKLEEELASKERAKSMAEMTKAGNVYVISNIGSFGENIFKVGMTRRLIPEDRVKELGDASVPFLFDIHMMIPSENAPELEGKLHEELWHFRMNYVNGHKEFFQVSLDEIKKAVNKHCPKGSFKCIEEAPALQWRETLKLKELGIETKYDPKTEIINEEDEDKVAA